MTYYQMHQKFVKEKKTTLSDEFLNQCERKLQKMNNKDQHFNRRQLERAMGMLSKNLNGHTTEDERTWLARYLNNNELGQLYRDMQFDHIHSHYVQAWSKPGEMPENMRQAYHGMLKQFTRPQYALIAIDHGYGYGLNQRQLAGQRLTPSEKVFLDCLISYDVLAIIMKSPATALDNICRNNKFITKEDMQPPFVTLRLAADKMMRALTFGFGHEIKMSFAKRDSVIDNRYDMK